MQIRNNYDIIWSKPESITFSATGESAGLPIITPAAKPQQGTGIFNGDVGIIAAIDAENEVMTVLFDDRLAAYGFDMLSELEHAYAMTVHKSQGSEYPVVLLALVKGHFPLLVRNLLYTAVTRAKKRVILFGDKAALDTAVSNDRVRRRYSLLAERLVDESFFA